MTRRPRGRPTSGRFSWHAGADAEVLVCPCGAVAFVDGRARYTAADASLIIHDRHRLPCLAVAVRAVGGVLWGWWQVVVSRRYHLVHYDLVLSP